MARSGSLACPPLRSSWLRGSHQVMVLVLLLPALAALMLALRDHGASAMRWWGAARGWTILLKSIGFAAMASTWALLAAVIAGRALASQPRSVMMSCAAVACAPLLAPSSLLASAWIMALGREGVISAWWGGTVNIYDAPLAAMAVGMRYFGVALVIMTVAMARQRRASHAERLFNMAPAARLLHLRLRPALPAGALAWLLVLILALNDHIMPGLFLIHTYGTQVLIEYAALHDAAGAAALAWPVVALTLPPLALLLRRGRGFSAMQPTPALTPARFSFAVAPAIILIAWATVLPLVALATRAGSIVEALGAAGEELAFTAWMAGLAGVLCAGIGAILAEAWRRAMAAGRPSFAPLLLLTLALPPSLIALGVLQMFGSPPLSPLRDTHAPLLFAWLVRFAPVAMLVIAAMTERRAEMGETAAKVHGVSRWRIVASIVLPQRYSAIAAAMLLCTMLAATELEAALLLVQPGVTTLGVRLNTMIHNAPDALVSALALGLTLLLVPLMVLLLLLMRSIKNEA